MSKYFKPLFTALVASALIFSLAACNNDGSATTSASEPASSSDTSSPSSDNGSAAADSPEYTFTVSVDASEEEAIYKYAVNLKEEIEARSNGRMKVDVYGNAALGGDEEALQSCADGIITFTICTTAPQVSFMPEMAMFDLPNLFDNIQQFRALFTDEEFYGTLQGIYNNNGYQLMGVADSGFRVMSSNKKIESLADFNGIKIRTMKNNNHIEIWKSLGANPTPMSFSEVYIGLQQGTIVAQENPVEVITAAKFYEQQKYIINTNHLPHASCLIMSKTVYDGLSADDKAIVDEAAAAASTYARNMVDKLNTEQLATIQDYGVEIVDLPAEVLDAMREAEKPVYELIKDQIGDDLYDLMLRASGN